MKSKSQFFLNLFVYVLFPVIGFGLQWILNSMFPQTEYNSEATLFLGLASMFCGFFYHLAYEQFSPKRFGGKFFKFLGAVTWIVSLSFFALILLGDYPSLILHAHWKTSFLFAILGIPIVFAIFRPLFYYASYKYNWSGAKSFICTILLLIFSYPISVLACVTSFIGAVCVIALIAFFIQVGLQGCVTLWQKISFNAVFYGAIVVAGLNLPYSKGFFEISAAFICVGFAFSFFLYYDVFERLYVKRRVKLFEYLDDFLTGVGGKICLGFGVIFSTIAGIATCFVFLRIPFPEMTKGYKCDFQHALHYALYLFPAVFSLFRWYAYWRGDRRNWGDVKKLIITIILPILCYAIAVACLCIGLYLVFSILSVVLIIFFILDGLFPPKVRGFQKYLNEIPPYSGGIYCSWDEDCNSEYARECGVVLVRGVCTTSPTIFWSMADEEESLKSYYIDAIEIARQRYIREMNKKLRKKGGGKYAVRVRGINFKVEIYKT